MFEACRQASLALLPCLKVPNRLYRFARVSHRCAENFSQILSGFVTHNLLIVWPWGSRQRCLLLSSRGVTFRERLWLCLSLLFSPSLLERSPLAAALSLCEIINEKECEGYYRLGLDYTHCLPFEAATLITHVLAAAEKTPCSSRFQLID